MSDISPNPDVVARLAAYFRRNGYVRQMSAARREKEGVLYKKGDEVRLVADTEAELADIRDLLGQAGFKLARPFVKEKQWRQPVYGVSAVARFLVLVGATEQIARRPPRPKGRPPGTPNKVRQPVGQPRVSRGRPLTRFTTRIIFDKNKHPRPATVNPPPADPVA